MEEDILNEIVASDDLKKYERQYLEEATTGAVSRQAQFNYAWCLVRSRYSADIKKGIIILEELYKTEPLDRENARRDHLYYLAIGNARLKDYYSALNYTRAFLQVEPSNHQVITLEALIKRKLEAEGIKGMALFGGAVLAVGGIVGVALALAKSKK